MSRTTVLAALIAFSVTAYSLPDAPQPQPAQSYQSFTQPSYTVLASDTSFLDRERIATIRRDILTGPNFAVGVRVPKVRNLNLEYVDRALCVWLPPGPKCK
jgi:hypothetical protein